MSSPTFVHRYVSQPLSFQLRDASTGKCWWENCDRQEFNRRAAEITKHHAWGKEAERSSMVNQVSEPK